MSAFACVDVQRHKFMSLCYTSFELFFVMIAEMGKDSVRSRFSIFFSFFLKRHKYFMGINISSYEKKRKKKKKGSKRKVEFFSLLV